MNYVSEIGEFFPRKPSGLMADLFIYQLWFLSRWNLLRICELQFLKWQDFFMFPKLVCLMADL